MCTGMLARSVGSTSTGSLSTHSTPPPTPRPIRSQQVDRRTGLTLNEQRQINTRVRRGTQVLDAAVPNWATKLRKFATYDDDALGDVALAVQTLVEGLGYQGITVRAQKAGMTIPKMHLVHRDELDGGLHGFYPESYKLSTERAGLGLAWRKAIQQRLAVTTTTTTQTNG
jgi:hypothetical protein